MSVLYPIISVLIVSLISVVFAIPFFFKKEISNKVLIFLLSLSVGAILATVFVGFLPEMFENGYSINTAFYLLSGFLLMFVIEKFIHFHHDKKCENTHGHSHAYHLAPVNLIGDGVHNFIDGLVIAGSFAVSPGIGITATIAIILHEIPQEIADFGVLLYSGMSKKKALVFNFLSALTAILGAVIGIVLIGNLHGFMEFSVAFAAGNFIYIAASNLVPQLHKHCDWKDTLLHIFAILLGIALITSVAVYGPEHSHGVEDIHIHENNLEIHGHVDSIELKEDLYREEEILQDENFHEKDLELLEN